MRSFVPLRVAQDDKLVRLATAEDGPFSVSLRPACGPAIMPDTPYALGDQIGGRRGRDRPVLHLGARPRTDDPLARALAGRDRRGRPGALERLNPTLNAFLTVTPSWRSSRPAPPRRARSRGELLGPIDGIPVSIKDLEPMAGVRCTFGSKWSEDNIADRGRRRDRADQAGRRRAAGQDQHAALRLQGHVRQLPRGAVQEPLEARSHVRRVVRRGRRGGRGWARAARARLGRGRLGPHSGGAVRHLRPEAVVRAGAVRADRRLLGRPLARRPDDPHRPRCRHVARRHGRAGRPRPALDRRTGAGLPGRLRRRPGPAGRLERRPRLRAGRRRGPPASPRRPRGDSSSSAARSRRANPGWDDPYEFHKMHVRTSAIGARIAERAAEHPEWIEATMMQMLEHARRLSAHRVQKAIYAADRLLQPGPGLVRGLRPAADAADAGRRLVASSPGPNEGPTRRSAARRAALDVRPAASSPTRST